MPRSLLPEPHVVPRWFASPTAQRLQPLGLIARSEAALADPVSRFPHSLSLPTAQGHFSCWQTERFGKRLSAAPCRCEGPSPCRLEGDGVLLRWYPPLVSKHVSA